MHVAVGSRNPVKIAATERTVGERFDARIEAVGVDSGVSEQPLGHEETVLGARTRAHEALGAVGADLGVGIEGGVARFDGAGGGRDGPESDFLVMWAAVTDGEHASVGAGPSLPLPASVAERVRDGEELGPIMDDLTNTDGVARNQGAAGVLTDGLLDRESALAHAVAGALGPFLE